MRTWENLQDVVRVMRHQIDWAESTQRAAQRDLDLNKRYRGGERTNATAGPSMRLNDKDYQQRILELHSRSGAFRQALGYLEEYMEQHPTVDVDIRTIEYRVAELEL